MANTSTVTTSALSPLVPFTTGLTAISNILLVSPQKTIGYQPLNPLQPNGQPSTAALPSPLIFHYEGEQTANLESDITDHYVENNISVVDQIALRPETITTHGFIGELNDVAPLFIPGYSSIPNSLTTLGAYVPGLSATALIAYTQAFQLYQTEQTVENNTTQSLAAVGALSGGGENVIGSSGLITQAGSNPYFGQNKQQTMFQQFYSYWRNRQLFTVQTPWAVFQNMAIKSLRAIQDAETNTITDFEITFKIIRTVSYTQILTTSQNRLALMSQLPVNNGVANPNSSVQVSQTTALATVTPAK